MSLAAHDWMLVVDADERVTERLRTEIEETLSDPVFRAYSIPRENYMLGKRIRYSGLQRDRVTRLFDRQHARYPNRRVHADMVVNGETGTLVSPLEHNYVRSLDHLVDKMKRYGVWGGAQLYRDGRRPGIVDLLGRPAWRFFRDWILALGILDGWRGFVLSGFHAFYTFFKYAKAREHFDAAERGLEPVLPPFEESPEVWRLPWEAEPNEPETDRGPRR